MTRINAGVSPSFLCNKHLIAEHREIKRIPNVLVKRGAHVNPIELGSIPETFCLGEGHVKFFYNKLEFLYKRYRELYFECLRRGFNVQYYGNAFLPLRDTLLWQPYEATEQDALMLAERINERLNLIPSPGLVNWHRLIDGSKGANLKNKSKKK